MGTLMWGAYGLQTIGLAQTTAGKSAFLTGTYCILVPFASYVLSGEKLTRYNLGAALLCLAGIGLVALDSVEFNVGDVITLGGAVFFAIQMAVTAKYGRKMDINAITFWMFVGNGVLSLISSLLFETQAPLSVWTPSFIGVMAFLSVGCTCVALLIQNVGLAHVPASTGSLLLSMESPSGVLFSVLLMGEALTSRLLAGFALIFLSIILSETHFDFLRRKVTPAIVNNLLRRPPRAAFFMSSPLQLCLALYAIKVLAAKTLLGGTYGTSSVRFSTAISAQGHRGGAGRYR